MKTLDQIVPTEIEHRIDEIWDGTELEQRYNYLDYHFESAGGYCRARVYIDEPQSVTLFGPFDRKGSIVAVAAPELEAEVMAYLERRFREVKRL